MDAGTQTARSAPLYFVAANKDQTKLKPMDWSAVWT